MIRNGWWCPDHGFYDVDYLSTEYCFIPLGAVVNYSKIGIYDNSHRTLRDGKGYKEIKVFYIRLFGTEKVYLADARDLKEFEDNLPSGLLFNCPKPE